MIEPQTVEITFKDTNEVTHVEVVNQEPTIFNGNRYINLFTDTEMNPCSIIMDKKVPFLLRGQAVGKNREIVRRGDFMLNNFGNLTLLRGILISRDGKVHEYIKCDKENNGR